MNLERCLKEIKEMREELEPVSETKIIWVDDPADIDETQENVHWVYLRKDVFDIGDDEDGSSHIQGSMSNEAGEDN